MRSAVPVLQLTVAQAEHFHDLGVNTPLSLRLLPGECTLIEASEARQLTAFADLCSGLITLHSGNVRFVGRDWSDVPHDYAAALRSRIGRVFATGGWLPFLDVETNILLPQLHHTRRGREELRREAQGLAREFGLPGLPLGRVDALAPADLGRAGLVRAFLGEPLLVLLEDPIRGLLAPIAPAVLNRAAITQDRGGAVVWLARSGSARLDPSFAANQRLHLGGEGLVMARRQAA
jgi:phospholipid/cholesterol/gamma-HCH transport system ATP-binding protein